MSLSVWQLGEVDGFTVGTRGVGARFQRIRGHRLAGVGAQLYIIPDEFGEDVAGVHGAGSIAAAMQFSFFQGKDPKSTTFVDLSELVTGPERDFGPVISVFYYDGRGDRRVHRFEKPLPRLKKWGRLWGVTGGSYQVTQRGIVG